MLLNPPAYYQPMEKTMAEAQKMRGEKIYECDFNITA